MLNIKKIRLTANYILVTKEVYDGKTTEGGVIIPKGNMKEFQKVVTVGPMVRGIKEGDLVCINPKRYAVHQYKEGSIKGDIQGMDKVVSYNFNQVKIDGKPHLLITEQDIDFVIEEYEEVEGSGLIVNKPTIIT